MNVWCFGIKALGCIIAPKALPNYWWLGSMKPTSNINKSQSFKITKKPIIEPVQKTNPNSKNKKKNKKPQEIIICIN